MYYYRKLNHLSTSCPFKTSRIGAKAKWGPKTVSRILCSFISLRASTCLEWWYLDFGCSNHLIENISYFKSLNKYYGGNITFETMEKVTFAEKVLSKLLPSH